MSTTVTNQDINRDRIHHPTTTTPTPATAPAAKVKEKEKAKAPGDGVDHGAATPTALAHTAPAAIPSNGRTAATTNTARFNENPDAIHVQRDATTTKKNPPTPHLTNNGGGILSHPNIQTVYVGNYFNTKPGQADRQHNDAALNALVHDKGYMGVLKQYGVQGATTSPSSVLGGNYKPGQVVTQAQLESMLQKGLKDGSIKENKNGQTIYNFVLPPGVTLEDSQGNTSHPKDPNGGHLGGFHGSVKDPHGKEVYYSVAVYGQGANGIQFSKNPRDNISVVESHEISEAATDPHVEDAIRTGNNKYLGWYDNNYGEIGDIGIAQNESNVANATQRIHGGYLVQKEWSNQDGQIEVAPKPKPKSKDDDFFSGLPLIGGLL